MKATDTGCWILDAGYRILDTGIQKLGFPLFSNKFQVSSFKHLQKMSLWIALTFLFFFFSSVSSPASVKAVTDGRFLDHLTKLAALGDRSTGTPGSKATAAYVKTLFVEMGFDRVGSHRFSVPVLRHGGSTITLPDQEKGASIYPIKCNAISPGTIPPPGIEGPLIYAGTGEWNNLNGKTISKAIILMEFDSGRNWLHAASLGAKALIYVDRGDTDKTFFKEKTELSPIHFPRFWMPISKARELFGSFEAAGQGHVADRIRLISDMAWHAATAENIYGLIAGTDPKLKEELIIVEAFYDSMAFIPAHSPGADEACSLSTLLELARTFKHSPPARSVLLVATSGHAQTLAGMRELVWSIRARSKELKNIKRRLKKTADRAGKILHTLKNVQLKAQDADNTGVRLPEALSDRIKTEVDQISRRLMELRLKSKEESNQDAIQELAKQRLLLRRLDLKVNYENCTQEEIQELKRLIPLATKDFQRILTDAKDQLKALKSAQKFRRIVKSMSVAAVISLHLSSHGDGVGAFNQGWLYPLKPQINRVSAYSTLDAAMRQGALEAERSMGIDALFQDTLRPRRLRTWESYFFDRPPLGGEVSALAGYLGVSLVTVNDARPMWGTPYDSIENVDKDYAIKQSTLVCSLISYLTRSPSLHTGNLPRNGFSTVTGHANFLRHGELFADQPAPGSVILSYQGPGRYYSIVDSMGMFQIKGVADKKHVLHKVIIEGYRFDPATGSVIWAIDKKQTGKSAYRVKMRRRSMETDLVMFACKQATLFNLLEPRNFRYMSKIQLLDARREALPIRYWYSRIDTWQSIITSVFLEPGTPFKMTLSDTVLQKKLILTNGSDRRPEGTGYLVDEWPIIPRTEFRVARDMWMLLLPRIANLEDRGIFNERIRRLQQEGTAALEAAEQAFKDKRYDRYIESATRSWALASRVYNDVEKTQKDVLFGVLFYIALFVPFAFCLERLIFSYSNIYKRITAFFGILILLIGVIYNVHPAFQLAYSPMVVILAFFIMGLSLIVTLIIFFRFEEEMILLQRRATQMRAEEVSRWKAFTAAFFLGVSNLRRRRFRTLLTCSTLIILTFTIMSFTSVKSMRHHARFLYKSEAPYRGFLVKNANWQNLPPEALAFLSSAFSEKGIVAPRVWWEAEDKTRSTPIPVRFNGQVYTAKGLVGLSTEEIQITGLDRILVGGKWFGKKDRHTVLLPERMAISLGIDPRQPEGVLITLWGIPFRVTGVFSGKKLQNLSDLDGEPLSPVTFPREISMELTEVEMEAFESGEDIQTLQSRYEHISTDLTMIIPFQTLLAAGGHLKSLAIRPFSGMPMRESAQELVDRFGLFLFSGEEDGTFLYNASDTLSYSGVPNILIPLIISIFIVLNTMIGSVYERKREIGIYTSVGLAPSHVSFLFIAEALAFAVLSVVLGYLLAQTSAKFLSGTTLWAGITVNYSSLAGVAAMLLVILVVLISVIYPSRVAAEIAIPDVKRAWKLPESQGNDLEITLPFLMKYAEQRSIGGYIFDYFKGHQDVTHGLFSTGNLGVTYLCPLVPGNTSPKTDCEGSGCSQNTCIQISSRVWLAPFDFGIMQMVNIVFCHAMDEAGFLEIKVVLTREAGEANAWRRINKAFLNELRKQLLIWRSLDSNSKADYERLLPDEINA